MKYYSLTDRSRIVSFRQAVINGQAPGKGLYFPELVPKIDSDLLQNIDSLSTLEIAFRVLKPYIGDDISEENLYNIIRNALNFPIPLKKINREIYSLELFHGPTMAFKDVGARFLAGCLQRFSDGYSKKMIVLVATSGDTGGAVADAFKNTRGVHVVILYPADRISPVQEQQIRLNAPNIHPIKVNGTFDDCQALVKSAFADKDLLKSLLLTSANSINIGRWLPQQVYYHLAYKQWPFKDNSLTVSVPCGNFGNLAAGLLAKKSGLPISHFIAACNANDTIHRYLSSGEYNPGSAIRTLSTAMDVSDPNNFPRILQLFNTDHKKLKQNFSTYSVTDELTSFTMNDLKLNYSYDVDPHSAVAYAALKNHLLPGQTGIILATAHNSKFSSLPNFEYEKTTEVVQTRKGGGINVYNEIKQYLLSV